ncbi:MAG TPA: hypothetical protein VGM20_04285 [Gemmatimonadales bacterium]|jgi:hypothetical protein
MNACKEVPVDSDWEFEFDARRKNAATGNAEVATGLSGVSGYFVRQIGDSPLGSTQVTLNERANTQGRYSGICDAAAMTAALSGLTGTLGYQVFDVDGDRITHERVIFVKSGEPR